MTLKNQEKLPKRLLASLAPLLNGKTADIEPGEDEKNPSSKKKSGPMVTLPGPAGVDPTESANTSAVKKK